jgi:hypothetical protein
MFRHRDENIFLLILKGKQSEIVINKILLANFG